MELEAYRENL